MAEPGNWPQNCTRPQQKLSGCPLAWSGVPLQQFFRWQFRRGAGHSPKTSCPPTIAFRTIPGAAHARGASAASMPCPSTLPSRPPCCGVRFFAHAPAPGRARTKLPGERQQTAHEIWARRSGHFSMPATALHRSESYLSRPVAPFNAAGRTLFGPTRVPHDGLRIPPARSCPRLCLKVLCEPVDSCFSLKLLNGFYTKPV